MHAPTNPRNAQQKSAAQPAAHKYPRATTNRPKPSIAAAAIKKPPTSSREPAWAVMLGNRPIAIPQAKAAAMATAGNFTVLVSCKESHDTGLIARFSRQSSQPHQRFDMKGLRK